MGGFRCASGVSARFWAQVRPGGAGLGPGSPIPRWVYAAREFVPRVTTTGVCQAEDPTSPCGAATSPKGGMPSICVSLYGASTRVGARCLSLTPTRVVAACWGDRGNRTGRCRSRPYATAQPRFPPGVSGFPVANALPCRGRPPFLRLRGWNVAARLCTVRAAGGMSMWGL